MQRKGLDFERVGIGYMPCSVAGWGCLFAFVITTLVQVLLATAVWAIAGWHGAEVIQGAILMVGVLATVRFARNRSQ